MGPEHKTAPIRPDSYQCRVLTHNPVAWARRAVVERIEQAVGTVMLRETL